MLRQHRETLITVTVSGDRHGGPQVDNTANPVSGVPDITGPKGHDGPVVHAIPAWNLLAGNLCFSALLAAERYGLRKDGGGTFPMLCVSGY